MDEFTKIKKAIAAHRRRSNVIRFPGEIWQQIMPLTEKYELEVVAKKTGLNITNLRKRLGVPHPPPRSRKKESPGKTEAPSFVQLPTKIQPRGITLELPHGIKLRIEL